MSSLELRRSQHHRLACSDDLDGHLADELDCFFGLLLVFKLSDPVVDLAQVDNVHHQTYPTAPCSPQEPSHRCRGYAFAPQERQHGPSVNYNDATAHRPQTRPGAL